MGPYLGDVAENATIQHTWDTNDADGKSVTPTTAGTIEIHKGANVTGVTTGVTDVRAFAGLAGVHHLTVLMTDAWYETGEEYRAILKTATIDGQNPVHSVLCSWSIENRFVEVDVTKIGGSAQSATDLKDFADAGYDPATNKVEGVKTVDTTTANTDMRGTDSAALASVCTETRLAELAAANLPADVDAILADTNELQSDDVPGLIAALNDPTVGDVADAVWDETTTGHVGAGTFGEQCKTDIDAILADTNELQTDDVPTLIAALNNVSAADVNTQCDTAIADAALATAANLATVDTVVDAVKAKTDNLPTDPADQSLLIAATDAIKAETALIVADTNELQTDDVPGLIAALNNVSTAEVNAEVLDVMNTDTFAEMGAGAPPASPTFQQMVHWLYTYFRNKRTQTATTVTIRNDADDGTLATSTVNDDGTTFTKGEFS